MIEGKCPKCGQWYYGWGLIQPRNQSCAKCGVGLLITMDGKEVFEGYSPFTAEKHTINIPKTIYDIEAKRKDRD